MEAQRDVDLSGMRDQELAEATKAMPRDYFGRTVDDVVRAAERSLGKISATCPTTLDTTNYALGLIDGMSKETLFKANVHYFEQFKGKCASVPLPMGMDHSLVYYGLEADVQNVLLAAARKKFGLDVHVKVTAVDRWMVTFFTKYSYLHVTIINSSHIFEKK